MSTSLLCCSLSRRRLRCFSGEVRAAVKSPQDVVSNSIATNDDISQPVRDRDSSLLHRNNQGQLR
jgi:hypothetical protein